MSTSCDTPIGVLTWDGPLTETTTITMPDGRQVPFYSLISHTNGDVFSWVEQYLKP